MSNTFDTNMLCLPSKIKIERIKNLMKELCFQENILLKTNYAIKCYKDNSMSQELENDIASQNIGIKVQKIIKSEEVRKNVKLKGKNGEVLSLFNLGDTEISEFYGDIALDLKDKLYLKEKINCQMFNSFKRNLLNSDEPFFEKIYVLDSLLNKEFKIVQLFGTLQSEINMCQTLLSANEGLLQKLVAMRKSNDKLRENHVKCIINEAEDLTLNARIIKLKAEAAMLDENGDIIKAMDILKDKLEKLLLEAGMKLRQLSITSEEYKKVDGKEFKKLLSTYVTLQKSIKNRKCLLSNI